MFLHLLAVVVVLCIHCQAAKQNVITTTTTAPSHHIGPINRKVLPNTHREAHRWTTWHSSAVHHHHYHFHHCTITSIVKNWIKYMMAIPAITISSGSLGTLTYVCRSGPGKWKYIDKSLKNISFFIFFELTAVVLDFSFLLPHTWRLPFSKWSNRCRDRKKLSPRSNASKIAHSWQIEEMAKLYI